jgi:RES domain-containing protein
LWRLSGKQHAGDFDGGYGLLFDGRWNSVGHAVTYCSTSPSLCVLEKLVHIEDPALLPDFVMLTYLAPDPLPIEAIELGDLPADWRRMEEWTRRRGDSWHRSRATPLLRAPSVIVPLADSPDCNVIVNHHHPGASEIKILRKTAFALDARLV